MARWLVSLMLLSGVGIAGIANANTAVLELLSNNQGLTPQMLMAQVEKQYPGVISEFDIDVENGELIYEISIIDTQAETISEFEFWAKDGSLIHQKVEPIEADDHDGVRAVQVLINSDLSFSHLVKLAVGSSKAHVIEAQLDHDLGKIVRK